MLISTKYKTEDLYHITCPICNYLFDSIYGKDSFNETEFPAPYHDKLSLYHTCFALCDSCHLSIYFERQLSSKLFFVQKAHFEFSEINYASYFNISKSKDKDTLQIQNSTGSFSISKKTKVIDKTLFDYLEKLRLLDNSQSYQTTFLTRT